MTALTAAEETFWESHPHHARSVCRTPLRCVIHNPSNHQMRTWPLHWRSDRGIVERICIHGVGHPDPDQLFPAGDDGTHGCDGCCSSTDEAVTA